MRVLLSGALGLVPVLWVLSRLDDRLDVETDVVGYPTFVGFKAGNYETAYLAWLVGGAIAIAAFHLSGRFAPGLVGRRPEFELPSRDEVTRTSRWTVARPHVRLALPSLVVGLELGVALFSSWPLIWGAALVGAVALPLLARTTTGRLAPRLEHRFGEGSTGPLVEVGFAFVALAGLGIAAAGSELRFLGGGSRTINWFPPVVALPVLTVAALWVWRRLRGVRDRTGAETLAGTTMVAFALPALVFMLAGAISPGIWAIDLFHHGEVVTPAELLSDGLVPWRDIVTIHGFGNDALPALYGLHVVDHTLWGGLVGLDALAAPLYLALVVALVAYLTERNWVLVAFAVVLTSRLPMSDALAYGPGAFWEALPAVASHPMVRFLMVPLSALVLGAAVRRRSRGWWVALSVVLVVQAVLFPEGALFDVVVAGGVSLFCIVAWKAGERRPFEPLLWCAVAGAASLAAVLAVLASIGAFGDFVTYFTTFSSDHGLTGSKPIDHTDKAALFFVGHFAAPALVALAAPLLANRVVKGKATPVDWVALVMTGWTALYYLKFLIRPDIGHGQQSAHVAVPLMFWLLHRGFEWGERSLLRWETWRHLAARVGTRVPSIVVVVVVCALIGPHIRGGATSIDERFHRTVFESDPVGRFGYMHPGNPVEDRDFGFDQDYFDDVETVINAAGGADPRVFDFTNSPLLFHFLLDHEPATSYYHVSTAIREDTQADLIDELEADPPQVVVYSSQGRGLPLWDDIPNTIRHYDISEWILDRYEPYALIRGYGIWVPEGRAASLPDPTELDTSRPVGGVENDPYAQRYACDWGQVPHYFAPAPSEAELDDAPVLTAEIQEIATVTGWAIDNDGDPADAVYAFADDELIGEGRTGVERPDVAAEYSDRAKRSGFQLVLALPDGVEPADLTIVVARQDGAVLEIEGPEVDPAALAELGLRRDTAAVTGDVNAVARSEDDKVMYRVHLPEGAVEADWLAFDASPEEQTKVTFAEVPGAESHEVRFTVRAGETDELYVPISACPQWRGFEGDVYLVADHPLDDFTARLVPD